MSAATVGVLTFHRCINHGSYWQARCLVEGIRSRGHDAVILDHHAPRVNRAEWRCALEPTLPTPVPRGDRPLYRAKVIKFREAIASLPLSPRFDLDHAPAVAWGTVVVGSDEVWNLHHPWYGRQTLFFGQGLGASRLVSYAASFGNYDASHGLESHWTEYLRAFRAIAVRDENSRQIVSEALGEDPPLVLDPCLQFPTVPDGPWNGPDGPFVAVYGHNFSPTFAGAVKRWAKENGRSLVSVGYRNEWADRQWLDAGPQDFAHAMQRASAVVTNFFHGCVFALSHDQPFVCESSPYRGNKVRGLMAAVGAEKHLMSAEARPSDYDLRLSQPPDAGIGERIRLLRRSSDEYLDHALG